MLQQSFLSGQRSRPLGRTGTVSLAAGLAIMILVAAGSIWQDARNAAALARADHTQRIRTTVGNVMRAAQDAISGQRGYLLTGNEAYLRPFDNATAVLPRELDELDRLAPPGQRVGPLRQAVTAVVTDLRQTVALARGGDRPAALEQFRSNAGAEAMRTVRTLSTSMILDLDAALSVESARITRDGRLSIAIDIAGLLLLLGLAGVIAMTVRGYLAGLRQAQNAADQANARLETLNDRLEETVRERTSDLIAANDEIQRFAYIVSHDLRAPLVNIMGFTSELQQAAGQLAGYAASQPDAPAELREIAQDDIPEALRFITSSTSKMDRLINAILKLSREGRRVLTAENLAMPALLGTIIETVRHQAVEKGAAITVGDMPDLIGDRVAVEQVFGNLLDNALKYLKPGRPGEIRISGRIEAGSARFDVTDNGRGIAARDYERVFELFRRAGDQSVPGEGIGLAHVRALVRRLGGSIDCASTLEIGTTFTVALPLAPHYARDVAA